MCWEKGKGSREKARDLFVQIHADEKIPMVGGKKIKPPDHKGEGGTVDGDKIREENFSRGKTGRNNKNDAAGPSKFCRGGVENGKKRHWEIGEVVLVLLRGEKAGKEEGLTKNRFV